MVQEKEYKKYYRKEPFYCVFQPIVNIRTRKIIGYEALVRGRGKAKLPEDIFRRSYEEGLTIALNLECFNLAFKILPKLGKGKLLFVNVEPITLARCFSPGGEADILVLSKIGKYRRQVVFELTEGMKIRDFHLIKRAVKFIKSLGCKFAIDDVVGIGAKLFKMVSLKPEFIKVGMGLVRQIHKRPLQQDLTRQLINLGQGCGSTLIAEGVERKKEMEAVQEMGVDYVQGFYYSRPKKALINTIKRR